MRSLLEDRLQHLVSNTDSFWESWSKVALDALEPVFVRAEISEGDAVGPRLREDGIVSKMVNGIIVEQLCSKISIPRLEKN